MAKISKTFKANQFGTTTVEVYRTSVDEPTRQPNQELGNFYGRHEITLGHVNFTID